MSSRGVETSVAPLVRAQIATITRPNRFPGPIGRNSLYVIVAGYLSRPVLGQRRSKRRHSTGIFPLRTLPARLSHGYRTIPETCSSCRATTGDFRLSRSITSMKRDHSTTDSKEKTLETRDEGEPDRDELYCSNGEMIL